MRLPSILDVVQAVKTVAPSHPEVSVWWYTPPMRLRLAGELGEERALPVEVVVEADGPMPVACSAVATELSHALAGATVRVRPHKGVAEPRPLFRVISRRAIPREDRTSV